MKKLIVKDIKNFTYILNDENHDYKFNFEFYDVDISNDDIIYMHDSLLINTNELLAFGPINGVYGRNIENENDPDLLIVKKNNKLIYLKRYYG